MDDVIRIACYMAASTAVLAAIIFGVAQGRARATVSIAVAALISVIGILFDKFGANFGLPWTVYYTVPMLATVFIPPFAFRLGLARSLIYVVLALVSAPLIHIFFVTAFGWTDYMPFFKIGG
jgi:hypothetical protein